LEIAGRIRAALQTNPKLIQLKDKKEYVTQADIQIQKYLLNYFINSPLAGTYSIKAEEKLSQEEQKQNRSNCQFQLIIDPLDGTSAFCKGEETWGSMVGLCDQEGRIIYSWNLISNGEIFSSTTAKGVIKHRCL
jgi:fructose-1,6-bisphosphatase/inositol monophosphatase family enzyme